MASRLSIAAAVRGAGLGFAALVGSGCPSNACLDLCAEWYDYRERECGDATASDALARCESDYRSVEIGSAVDGACADALASGQLDRDDDACCDLPRESCLHLPYADP